jgi:hypothetical protein
MTTNGSNTASIGFEQQIWAAADILRGNMDAAEYKHVVLGLIFLKYISDKFNFDSYRLCHSGLFTELAGNRIKCNKYPEAKLTYMTVHSAKGLGFDNVIILNMSEGRFGFPCQLEDDPIMKLVRFKDTSVPFAEERGLFYVALTRTKNLVYILTPQKRPSRFLIELINDYKFRTQETSIWRPWICSGCAVPFAVIRSNMSLIVITDLGFIYAPMSRKSVIS